MMRLPVATTDPRPSGLSLAEDGELVMVPFDCPDPGCDCRTWFSGLKTRNATTLAVVAEVRIDPAGLRDQIQTCLGQAHQVSAGLGPIEPDEMKLVISTAIEMVGIGDTFAVGTRIARQDDMIYEVHEDPPVPSPRRIDIRRDTEKLI